VTVTIRHLLNHSSGLCNNVPEIAGCIHITANGAYVPTIAIADLMAGLDW
jgi:CubicO group peptidase (beta-lactamase class C family)